MHLICKLVVFGWYLV